MIVQLSFNVKLIFQTHLRMFPAWDNTMRMKKVRSSIERLSLAKSNKEVEKEVHEN